MVFVTIALLLSVVALFYLFLTWNFNFWQKRKVPGPKPELFTGNYPNMYKTERHAIYDLNEVYRKYKNEYDAVGIFQGRSPQLFVTSPELAHRIFVTDFKSFHDNELSSLIVEKNDYILGNNMFTMTGDKWKQRRALITPGLTMGRIKTVYPVTKDVCGKMTEFIKKQIRIGSKDGVNGKELSLRFSTEIVTDCVLGLGAQSFTDNPTPILSKVTGLFNQSFSFIVQIGLISVFPVLRKLKTLRFIPKHVEVFFVGLMQSALDARKSQLKAGKTFDRVDFLDYIMELARKQNLDTRQCTAYTMTFLLDGFDTTATVMSHTLLLLGRDPAIQQRLRDEIKAHLNDQGAMDFDKLHELPFLDACVQESLRLFPPLTYSNKTCTQTIELPNRNGNNITVPKGTTVVVPHDCFMKDEDYFPNPEQYQPDRFMEPDAAKKYRERGVFMSFGDGPRICIGMRFAMTQIKAAIIEILLNFDIKVNPKTRKDNIYDPIGIVTKLKGDVWLDFVERK